MAVLEEAIFIFLVYFANAVDAEKGTFLIIFISCALLSAVLCSLGLLFKDYLIVNDQTVTLCKLFKRKQTVYWKDATITQTSVTERGANIIYTVIADGINEIKISNLSEKSLQKLQELCKTARESYNPDNLTF